MENSLNIYEFTDYREYLQAYYSYNKQHGKGFSYRSMAKDMGFTSPNYLKLIIDGDRDIGRTSLNKIINGLSLKKKEGEYFSFLVLFAKAKSEVEKHYYYSLIAGKRAGKVISAIQQEHYEYYEDWYNIVIRELVVGKTKNSLDFAALAKDVKPPILPKQAKKAVKLLEKLGFITVDDKGCYRYASRLINTANQVTSFAIKKYHTKMLELAGKSLHELQSHEREISACTVKISQKGFDHIKKRIQEFREELLQIAKDDYDVDRVAQINFQLFPISQVGGTNGQKNNL
jgi:uncharacterized protein (TIGR02147 family)